MYESLQLSQARTTFPYHSTIEEHFRQTASPQMKHVSSARSVVLRP
jgi:hypothetical protein